MKKSNGWDRIVKSKITLSCLYLYTILYLYVELFNNILFMSTLELVHLSLKRS